MLRYSLIIWLFVFWGCSQDKEITNKDSFTICHPADAIYESHPVDPNKVNNGASEIEICFGVNAQRRIRYLKKDTVVTEIVEPAPIHVRERAFICDAYFLLSDGSDSENVLGYYFDNTVYRISDGQKMTSFSSKDLPVKNCSLFKN